MKRRISDMLDGVSDQKIPMEHSTPLSPERIKERTMCMIERKTEHKGKRVLLRALAVAAAVSLLGITASAAEVLGAGSWFRAFFGYGETEAAVVDQLGEAFDGQGITSNGATITPEAGFGDASRYYLRLKVEAPEGTVLPDLSEGERYVLGGATLEDSYTLTFAKGAYQSCGWESEVTVLPDDDPTDNAKEFVIQWIAQQGGDLKFNDGISKVLTIRSLWKQTGEREAVKLLDGEWSFDIGLHNGCTAVALDVEGLTYSGETTFEDVTQPWTATVKKLTVSPLSMEWALDYTEMDSDDFGITLKAEVVMKDGTTAATRYGGGTADDTHSEGYTLFETPVDLAEIAYILIGDTHKVTIPK